MTQNANQVLPDFDIEFNRVSGKRVKLSFDDPDVSSNHQQTSIIQLKRFINEFKLDDWR